LRCQEIEPGSTLTSGLADARRSCPENVQALRAFRDKYGNLQADEFTEKVLALALEFLHEHPTADKDKGKLVKA
jgi:hypothetical protein